MVPPFRRTRSERSPPSQRRLPRALGAVGRGWRRARRATDRYRLLTDVVGGILLVALVLGGVSAATGGVWPPVLVIESGSMMLPASETPYGRVGTIDVGDVVFVRAVDDPRSDVTTWANGTGMRYGRPGDVIAFWQDGDQGESNLTIIHRAVAWVDVERVTANEVYYHLHWVDGQVRTFDSRGIYFPALGFREEFGFTPANGYKPAYSGFLTKGDNPVTNPAVDQALGISRMVEPAWIVGEVYGEVPWVGLAKLALQSGRTNPNVPGWERIGNGFAPLELWSVFFVVVALVVVVPFAIDTWRQWRRVRREEALAEAARREAEETARAYAKRAQQARPAPPRPRGPVTFVPVGPPRRPS